MDKLEKIISELNSDIVCSTIVAMKIEESSLYEAEESTKKSDVVFKVGTFNNKNVSININITTNDLRIFDESGIELIDLSDFGFNIIDMI